MSQTPNSTPAQRATLTPNPNDASTAGVTPIEESRRAFLGQLGMAAMCLCTAGLATSLSSCSDSGTVSGTPTGVVERLDIQNFPALAVVGGAIQQRFGNNNSGRNVLVVRVSESTVRAADVLCPHAGCNVGTPANNQVECPCHNSRFSLADTTFGDRLAGPAPRGLRTFATSFDGSTISITF